MYVKGLTVAPIAMVTTLNFTIPLFTLVLAALVLKEKVRRGPLYASTRVSTVTHL
jgi:drug/metabolite transporter (DMT)-like permease